MKIDKEILHKIAHLARLNIPVEKEDEMIKNLEGVLNWMEQLNEVDTTHVQPLIHMTQEMNVYREDIPQVHIEPAEALANAPKADDKYFRINKVM